MLGRPPNESISFIADKFKTSKSNAERIILTESAYISSLAHKDCFKNLEVEQFEVLETLDGKTCKICGDMDGRVFDMVDFAPSVTAPPFHPRCRGCTVPVSYTHLDVYKRQPFLQAELLDTLMPRDSRTLMSTSLL